MKKSFAFLTFVLFLISAGAFAQISRGELAGQMNTLQTAVPFLTIAPDSRAGAMGDVGVATSPDLNSMHWNPAKYAFLENDMGVSISYSPWLRNLVNDINLAYLTGFYRIDDQQVLAGALRYFSLGEIIFTDFQGEYAGQHTPNEFAISAAYSRIFSERISGGLAFRFIRSDLTGGTVTTGGGETRPGMSVAVDVSTYYRQPLTLSDKDGELSFGINISNIGDKISYTENQEEDFIPMNLRLGTALKIDLDAYNSMTFAFDLNKLLVPTPPVFAQENPDSVLFGQNSDVGVVQGIFQSFYDAPGGFQEEINEIMYSLGMEYWYREQFAIRAGYFHEHQNKGNRKYATLGIGLKLNVFGIDFSYLVPTAGRTNPLANTMRFTLNFDLGNTN